MATDKYYDIMENTYDTDDDICLECDIAINHPSQCEGCEHYSKFIYFGVDYPMEANQNGKTGRKI